MLRVFSNKYIPATVYCRSSFTRFREYNTSDGVVDCWRSGDGGCGMARPSRPIDRPTVYSHYAVSVSTETRCIGRCNNNFCERNFIFCIVI